MALWGASHPKGAVTGRKHHSFLGGDLGLKLVYHCCVTFGTLRVASYEAVLMAVPP